MASFNKKLLVAGFITMALLIASHHAGAAAPCGSRTEIMCTSDNMCAAFCLQKGGGYTGGYCSTEHVVGDPSCFCTNPCAAQSAAAGPGEKQAAGWIGMAN